MQLRRWTPFTFLFPSRYLDTDPSWANFDFDTWADREYTWIEDPWNGLLDFANRPADTLTIGRGDCEDFALVALAWAYAQNRDGLGIGLCFEGLKPWPTHIIAFDDERVYSSGEITEIRPREWIARSRYRFGLYRRIT